MSVKTVLIRPLVLQHPPGQFWHPQQPPPFVAPVGPAFQSKRKPRPFHRNRKPCHQQRQFEPSQLAGAVHRAAEARGPAEPNGPAAGGAEPDHLPKDSNAAKHNERRNGPTPDAALEQTVLLQTGEGDFSSALCS